MRRGEKWGERDGDGVGMGPRNRRPETEEKDPSRFTNGDAARTTRTRCAIDTTAAHAGTFLVFGKEGVGRCHLDGCALHTLLHGRWRVVLFLPSWGNASGKRGFSSLY